MKQTMVKEACVETLDEAIKAQEQGADRIELCSQLAVDGLTPSPELMQKACSLLRIPVMVMIRPREGNFVYTAGEVMQMKKDIDLAKEAGAAGVVFGLLTTDNKIDEKNTRLLADYASPLPVTFHKAIDELEDPAEGVRVLKTISGIERILTSGGKPTAKEGAQMLNEMMKEAGGKPIILVAGKVTDKNAGEIQQLTGAKEVHGRRIAGELI